MFEEEIDCLIQSDRFEIMKERYPRIHFIDINQNGFYGISTEVLQQVE